MRYYGLLRSGWLWDSHNLWEKNDESKNTGRIREFIGRVTNSSVTTASLLSNLKFSDIKNKKYPTSLIKKLYLFRLIKGFKTYEQLTEYLLKNRDEALELGIFLGSNKLDIPPKRTFNNYLAEIDKTSLNDLAKFVLSETVKNKVVLDIQIVKKAIEKKKIKRKAELREAVKLVKRLVYPLVDIKIKENGKFTTKDLLDVLVHVALTHDFANNGSITFKEIINKENSPSGDLMFYHFSKFESISQIENMFDNILEVILNFAKKEYKVLKRRKLDIAWDIHKIPYYGKSQFYVKGGKQDRGTSNFYEFLTCSVLVGGKRFIIDVVPVHPLDSIEKLIEKSVIKVKSRIKVDVAYLDRGFDKPKVINVLEKHKVRFIMPKIRSPTVKSWFEKSEGTESRIVHKFNIGPKENKAEVNLILVNDDVGIKRAFISNIEFGNPIAYRIYEMYSRRWGIETSYRNCEHDFKAKTTSNNYHIRLFYFIFSVCLYNLWVLTNICLSMALYGRISPTPIITAKLFAVILYKVRIDYFDSGG